MTNISITGGPDGPQVDVRELESHLDVSEVIAGKLGAKANASSLALKLDKSAYLPPYGAFQDLLGRLRTAYQDVNILIISDSTAAMAGSWADKLPAILTTLYPNWKVSYRKFVDGTNAYAAATVTGTGTRTINLWNGSIAGKQWAYSLQSVRRSTLVDATTPDLVIFSHGHNESQSASYQLRDRAVTSIERIRTHVPGAAIVVMSQNPLLSYPGMSEYRADTYRRICMERGYGFIDICRAFYDDGRAMNTLVSGDNVHPTDAGFTVWVNELAKHLATNSTAQPSPLSLPSLSLRSRNLLTNGDFSDFTAPPALPSWGFNNCTAAKDTVNMESRTDYSVALTKTAAGSAAFMYNRPNAKLVAGRDVTLAARIRIPAGAAGTTGQVAITDGYTAPILSSTTWGDYRDEWHWVMLTAHIDPRATTVECRVYPDPTTGSTLQTISVDRVTLALGRYPMDI